MTAALEGVPVDSFPIRLAVVRAVMGWNYDQAARATGIGSETWRTWEKGRRRCSDITTVSRRISAVTGLSEQWLVMGGPLAVPGPEGTVIPLDVRDRATRRYDDAPGHAAVTDLSRYQSGRSRHVRDRRRSTRRWAPRPFGPIPMIPMAAGS